MFLKKRWSRDPAARGGMQVSGGDLPPPSLAAANNTSAPIRTAASSASPLASASASASASELCAATAAAAAAATAAAAAEGKDTHGNRVVVREPGPHGLYFGLWLTGEEHIGVFSDSRPTRELVRGLSKARFANKKEKQYKYSIINYYPMYPSP